MFVIGNISSFSAVGIFFPSFCSFGSLHAVIVWEFTNVFLPPLCFPKVSRFTKTGWIIYAFCIGKYWIRKTCSLHNPQYAFICQTSWVRDLSFYFRMKNNYWLTQISGLPAPFPVESGAQFLKKEPCSFGHPIPVPPGWLARFLPSQLVLSRVTQPQENCFLMEP